MTHKNRKKVNKCHVLKFWMLSIKALNRISSQPKMLDPDPDPMNLDPEHCLVRQPFSGKKCFSVKYVSANPTNFL
jgi:hypothetical protein